MNFYRIKALFKLGIEDLLKNMNVFLYVVLPIFFAFLYSKMESPKESIFSLCVIMTLAMVPIALMATIIAEEKEKNTLRTLMLKDIKALEILIAKVMICILFVFLDNILIYFIIGVPMTHFIVYQLVCLFVGLAVILFGTVVGLVSKNQMSAGLLSVPAMLLVMAPLFIGILKNDVANKISSLIPTDAMMTIIKNISENTANFTSIGMPFFVILVWLIISVVVFVIMYKKVGIDN